MTAFRLQEGRVGISRGCALLRSPTLQTMAMAMRTIEPRMLSGVSSTARNSRQRVTEAAPVTSQFREHKEGRSTMHPRKRLSIKSATVAGIAASALLGLAGLTLNPAPANAVVYCTYVGYPGGCVARAGVVLRPRPVARAAVRHNAGGNMNGGVNRVGARR